MKILYAAGNRKSSYFTLFRFLETFSETYEIRAAAYEKSVGNLFVDYNLTATLNDNKALSLLRDELLSFEPDLIISDLDTVTSKIAAEEDINIWQVSPYLLHFGIKKKLSSYYLNIDNKKDIENAIANSEENMILSHIGDVENVPELEDNFVYVRPSYKEIESSPRIPGYSLPISDSFYSRFNPKLDIDTHDEESVVSSMYHKKYGSREIAISENILFLSQFLKSFDIELS